MKVALLTLLVAAGTAITDSAIIQARRRPKPGSESARELLNLVQNGLQTWGLAGAINTPSGNPSGPSRNMPGGLPELNRPHPPKQDGVPGHPDAIDEACQRRKDAPPEEQKQQQQAIDGLNQVAELCETVEDDAPSDANMKTKVLESCNKFAETLEDMVDANAGLVLMGEVARARTLNNHDIEDSDQAVVEELIKKGAFGPATNQTEISEIATLYLSYMSAYIVVELEEDGSEELIDHNEPPVWLELLQMGAGYVPEDRAAVTEALQLLDGSPYLHEFDKEGRQSLVTVQTCWDQAGLLAFQPYRWDIVSAGLVYLERKLRDTSSALACAPCMTPAGFWVLRCGSAVPYI
ncbi:hypothetical protein ARSEF4850_008809 [Beauveria asiatica]